MLSRRLPFKRQGSPVTLKGIPLPRFAVTGRLNPQGVFVVRRFDAPPLLSPNSLVVCLGNLPEGTALPKRCDVVLVDDASTADEVLNLLQDCIGEVANWLVDLSDLAARGANVRAMLERSIPIFANAMTITDYKLRVLAYCSVDRSQDPPTVRMDESYARIPQDMARSYIDRVTGNMRKREPFFFDDPLGHNFCVNLFEGNAYIGCCSLSNHAHEIEDYETQLFRMLAAHVRRALIAQGGTPKEQIPTMTSVFSRLVKREQVPRSQAEQAMGMLQRSPQDTDRLWRCTVIRNANRGKDMPEGYVIDSIEEIMPSAHAFFHEGSLVVFAPASPGSEEAGMQGKRLETFLADMNFRGGTSRLFTDVFSAYTAYRQAVCAAEADGDRLLRRFDDMALGYMLGQSMGEFDANDIIAPELAQLAALGPNGIGLEYIDTLRAYLDNNCNGLQTSKATYLHRSTLAQRIDRIRELVSLDSPEQRLYLQMCLHLPGVRWDEFA